MIALEAPAPSAPAVGGEGATVPGSNAFQNRRFRQNQKPKPKKIVRRGIPVPDKTRSVEELAEIMSAIRLTGVGGKDSGAHGGRFEDLELKPDLLKGIHAYGLEKPALVQQKAILPIIQGRDAIIQAQSGMGKTAALVIGILQKIDNSKVECQALVLVPTRELAEQLKGVFGEIGQFMGITTFTCVGGTKTKECKEKLPGNHIVVGTPGRVIHMLEDGILDLTKMKIFALDEADKMLSEFSHDLSKIIFQMELKTQVISMSATMPENILGITERFMQNPVIFLIGNQELTLDGIKQFYVNVEKEACKFETLCDIHEVISKSRGIIFVNSRAKVGMLSKRMIAANHVVSATQGLQTGRSQILEDFKNGRDGNRMIVASDLLGRGIDIQQVNFIINYDIPINKEEYIHRVGRAGRYGRHGVAITLVTSTELEKISGLEEFYATKIQEMPPTVQLAELI